MLATSNVWAQPSAPSASMRHVTGTTCRIREFPFSPDDALQPTPEIPDKLYFKIGEVSELLGVEPYVLRYWESEFPVLSPKKSGTGHRLYRRKDVELLLRIKHLLYDKRFTIEGARQSLQSEAKAPKPAR